MAEFFEDLDNQNADSDVNKPFFAINYEDDKALLDWLNKTMAYLRTENKDRLEKVRNNYMRYKGLQYRDQVHTPRDQMEKRTTYMPQLVVPVLADIVDEKVARLLEYKPGVQCIPQDDESADKVDAKIAKRFIKHIEQIESLDGKFTRSVRSAKIGGESFLLILWDKDRGGTILKSGETVQLPDGRTIKGPIKEGDIKTKNATALELLYEKAKSWEEVDYCFYFDHDYTEKLKREYPEKADQIHSTKVASFYDFESMQMKTLEAKTSTITFWHKKTKFLEEGFECLFTTETILKKGNLPYDHGEFPLEKFVDVENEQELSGESSMDKIKGLVSQYNNTKNLIIKQLMLLAHPKWFVEGGSVDEQLLGNDSNIVKIKSGSKPPVLGQANPVSPQLFEFSKELKQEAYEMGKSNSVVRGEPPPGVTAFVALQYVSESENRRISTDVSKTNESIRKVYDKILKTCGQFYKKTDKRTMLVLGKDNRWNVQKYDPSTLAKPYSIVLQNSSALPESKALRTQFVLDMGQRFPTMFPESQIAEMLDLGQSEKLLDIAGLAARAAEDENEMILDGDGVADPEIYEDLITHWKIHVSAIQDTGFKMKSEDHVQQNMKDHILATEMLMMDMAVKSTAFAQAVNMACPQFPLFMEIPAPQAPQIPGPAQMPEMNQGEVPKMKIQPGDPAFSSTPRPSETKVGAPPSDLIPV